VVAAGQILLFAVLVGTTRGTLPVRFRPFLSGPAPPRLTHLLVPLAPVQTGFDEGPYTVDAVVEIVRSDVGDVPHQKGQAFAALDQAAGIVGAQVSLQSQAVLTRGDGPAHDRLDLALVTHENPAPGVGAAGRDLRTVWPVRVFGALAQLRIGSIAPVDGGFFVGSRRTFAVRLCALSLVGDGFRRLRPRPHALQ
jgi:hypothetical protein